MKNCTRVLLAAALLGAAGSGVAGEQTDHVMVVGVAGDSAADGMALKLNSNELGFNLVEMQVGESRSIVAEDGRPILITRNEDGFSFNVDGKVIELPDFDSIDGKSMHWVTDGDKSEVDVHVIKESSAATVSESEGTVIISSEPINETTRQSIQTVLESAGHSGEVDFIDHSGGEHGQVFIRKVEKVVDNP